MINKIKRKFVDLYGGNPLLLSAPGRINIIGEHTDYNDGFVLPAAIDKAIYFAAQTNDVGMLRLYSIDYDEHFEIDINSLKKSDTHWANYLIGVVAQFEKKNLSVNGIDCVFGGDIPLGAGLSSSAALECGFAYAINELHNFQIEKSELILMAQKAEHEYAGVMCGIMDQFASIFGKSEHVVRLDCRSMEYEYFPFRGNGLEIILCNTGVSHELASSEYNVRRQECEEGLEILKKHNESVSSFRDVSEYLLNKAKPDMKPNVYDRCSYVIGEIQRVIDACDALIRDDFNALGKLMYQTHEGLSKNYLVSCKELDILVDIAKNDSNVYGARVMGGGFGGCTINLVKEEGTDNFIDNVKREYKAQTGIESIIYRVKIADGVQLLNN